MQKILAIATTDLRIFLSSRANLVGLLLIPSVLTIVLGFFGSPGSPVVDIAFVDDDQSEQSAQFIAEIDAIHEQFSVRLLENGIEAGRQGVVDGNYDALIVIPQGFGAASENFESVTLGFYSNEALTEAAAIQPVIEAVLGRMNGSIVAARVGNSVADALGVDVDTQDIYDTANAILGQNPVVVDYSVSAVDDDGGQSGFMQSVPGMGAMFVMFTILGGMAALIRERQQWTLQRLVVMPVSRAEILGGKILAYFTIGMMQLTVVFAIGYGFGMDYGSNWIGIILLGVAFSLAATSLTFALATFLRTEGQAGQLTTLLGLSLAALGGAWWPLDVVPDFMKVIGHLSPIAWVMDGFQDIIWYQRGLIDVLPEIGVLLGIAAVLFVIGIVNFKYE